MNSFNNKKPLPAPQQKNRKPVIMAVVITFTTTLLIVYIIGLVKQNRNYRAQLEEYHTQPAAANSELYTAEQEGDIVAPDAMPVNEYVLGNAPYLFTSVDHFRLKYNKAVEVDELKMGYVKVERGIEYNVFQYHINAYLAITGGLNKYDNSVRQVILTFVSDATNRDEYIEQNTNLLLAVIGLIEAIHPGISKAERRSILQNLGIIDDNLADGKKEFRYKGIDYMVEIEGRKLDFWAFRS